MTMLPAMLAVAIGRRVAFTSGPYADSGAVQAGFNVKRNGEVRKVSDNTLLGYWITPRNATIGDNYQVRCSIDSGDDPTTGAGSEAKDADLALSSDRDFFLDTAPKAATWTLTIKSSGGATLATLVGNTAAVV